MPAVEHQDHRSIAEQVLERYEMPVLVRHREQRHFVAHLGRRVASPRRLEPVNEQVDLTAECGRLVADGIGDSLQSLGQGAVAIARIAIHFVKSFRERPSHVSF